MIGKVTVWQMTPEELAAYREKYPPNQDLTKAKKPAAFSDIHSYGERRKNKDWKWRGQKGADSRHGT